MRSSLRLVVSEPQPAGWYVTAGWGDHEVVRRFLAGGGKLTGVVVSAGLDERQQALRVEARDKGVEVVLDTHAFEQSFEGGNSRGLIQRLPWARSTPARPRDLRGKAAASIIRAIADEIESLGCDAVIAPSHYLAAGISDRWFSVDLVLALRLRRELARRGRSNVRVYYRLGLAAALIRKDPDQVSAIAAQLRKLDIDAVWLRIHPFGTGNCGPLLFRAYMRACRTLHRIGVAVVAERTGTIGLALVALGAVGGIESGVGTGENFDVGQLVRVPNLPRDGGFGPAPRVYFPGLMSYLSRSDAEVFLANRVMRAQYGCTASCCRNGVHEMLRDPRRHMLHTRSAELAHLSVTPEEHRPAIYVDEMLAPATRRIVQAANVAQSLRPALERLATLGNTIEEVQKEGLSLRYQLPPLGERRRSEPPGPRARPRLAQ